MNIKVNLIEKTVFGIVENSNNGVIIEVPMELKYAYTKLEEANKQIQEMLEYYIEEQIK